MSVVNLRIKGKKLIVKAKTTKPILFFVWEKEHVVPTGTLINVDMDNMIAIIGQEKTDISLDEFEIFHQN